MKIKEFFKNARAKVSQMKIVTGIKSFFKNVFNNKVVKTTTDTVKNESEKTMTKTKEFINTHNNIIDSVAGNVFHRFQEKIKKMFKKFTKTVNDNSQKSKAVNIGRIALKIVCIIAAIAFAALVIYCIKDVFLYCLMLVATCAAVMLCIEFILWVLGTALSCKI